MGKAASRLDEMGLQSSSTNTKHNHISVCETVGCFVLRVIAISNVMAHIAEKTNKLLVAF